MVHRRLLWHVFGLVSRMIHFVLGLGVHLLLCLLLFLWQLHFLSGSLLLHHFCSYFFLSICILWCWFVGSCPALFLLLMLCWLLSFLGVILCSLLCFWLCFASFSKPVAPQSTERSASCHHQTVATDLHMSYENDQIASHLEEANVSPKDN